LPYHVRQVYVIVSESRFAHLLETLVGEFPELLLGSYPEVHNPAYRVKLTLESKDPTYLAQAYERLLMLLPSDSMRRME
jgi:hypothetical protein